MKKAVLLLLLFIAFVVTAQDKTVKDLQAESGKTVKKDAADTTTKKWKHGGFYGINVS
ncbi:MAG: hypothetical protein SGI83_12690 [Bacteroidota bacterium]|nr:hypothetical protein [Bacteroidota bacterium]